jgi:hypothetical protein
LRKNPFSKGFSSISPIKLLYEYHDYGALFLFRYLSLAVSSEEYTVIDVFISL